MQAEREREGERGEVRIGSNLTCPLCLELLTTMAQLEVCAGCRSIHHTACVAEMRRCGTIGCLGFQDRPPPPPPDADGPRVKAAMAWGLNVVAPILGPCAVWLLARSQGDAYAGRHARNATVLSSALALAALLLPRLGDELATNLLGILLVGYLVAIVVGMVRALRGTPEPAEPPAKPAPAKRPFDPPTPSSQLGSDVSTLE